MTIRPLTPDENDLVPSLWNAAWAAKAGHGGAHGGGAQGGGAERGGHNPYPLSHSLWRERLGSRHHDQSLLLGAFEAGELVGAVYAKVGVSVWQPTDYGWLALLCVARHRQGSGIGSSLAAAAIRSLRERGRSFVKLGGEADHLLPGMPQEASPAAWRLARRLGFSPTNAEHDLLLDLRLDLLPAPLPSGFTLRADRPAAALACAERVFPGRWAEELAGYLAAGATAITLEQAARGSADEPAPAQGFCVVFQGGECVTAPGLLWREALLADIGTPSTRLGGIGPLGVDPAVRGAGAGLAMVAGAAAWLKARGATDAVINWTTLTGFYGRLGARIWRTYQRMSVAPIPQEDAAGRQPHSAPSRSSSTGPDDDSTAKETAT